MPSAVHADWYSGAAHPSMPIIKQICYFSYYAEDMKRVVCWYWCARALLGHADIIDYFYIYMLRFIWRRACQLLNGARCCWNIEEELCECAQAQACAYARAKSASAIIPGGAYARQKDAADWYFWCCAFHDAAAYDAITMLPPLLIAFRFFIDGFRAPVFRHFHAHFLLLACWSWDNGRKTYFCHYFRALQERENCLPVFIFPLFCCAIDIDEHMAFCRYWWWW